MPIVTYASHLILTKTMRRLKLREANLFFQDHKGSQELSLQFDLGAPCSVDASPNTAGGLLSVSRGCHRGVDGTAFLPGGFVEAVLLSSFRWLKGLL